MIYRIGIAGALLGFAVSLLFEAPLHELGLISGYTLAVLVPAGTLLASVIFVAIAQTIKLRKLLEFHRDFRPEIESKMENGVDERLVMLAIIAQNASRRVIELQHEGLKATGLGHTAEDCPDIETSQKRYENEDQSRQGLFKKSQASFYREYDAAYFFARNFLPIRLRKRSFKDYLKSREEAPVKMVV